jgi:hypothetical protein
LRSSNEIDLDRKPITNAIVSAWSEQGIHLVVVVVYNSWDEFNSSGIYLSNERAILCRELLNLEPKVKSKGT